MIRLRYIDDDVELSHAPPKTLFAVYKELDRPWSLLCCAGCSAQRAVAGHVSVLLGCEDSRQDSSCRALLVTFPNK